MNEIMNRLTEENYYQTYWSVSFSSPNYKSSDDDSEFGTVSLDFSGSVEFVGSLFSPWSQNVAWNNPVLRGATGEFEASGVVLGGNTEVFDYRQLGADGIDPIVIPYCQKRGVLSEFYKIRRMLPSIFRGLHKFSVDFILDPETNEEKVVFTLFVTGDPDKILEEEDLFYRRIGQEVAIDQLKYFSLTYNVL